MTREQALAHRAINAGTFPSAAWEDDDSLAIESLTAERGVRSMEIIRTATSATNTKTISRDVLGRQVFVRLLPSHYLRHDRYPRADVKDFVTPTTLTDSTPNENNSNWLAVFDELRNLRADETRFREALCELRSMENVREGEAIAKRLEALLDDFQDDYGRCLDTESLRTFIALLSLHPELKRPVITAAENGNLFAEWKSEDGKRFLGLQLLPMLQVQFVTFQPNAKYSQLRNHSSGITSVDQVFMDTASYNILAWACVA